MRFKTLLFLALFSLTLQFAIAQSIDKLDQQIEQAMQSFQIPGMAVGIVKDGEVVLLKGYGVKNNSTGEKVDENTLFAIASISKAFTVAALSQLEDIGKLNWSDPVQEHVPYFRLHDSYVSSAMTIEDLTCHRSGLATFDGDLLWYGTDYTREEVIRRIRHLPLKKTFRTEFGYQNIMYITAGEVIKSVSGKTWDLYLQDHLLYSLGMRNTLSTIRDFDKSTNLAYPHIDGKVINLLNYDNCGATAALNSSASDMTKWIKMWMNEGKWEGKKYIDYDNFKRIWTPHTVLSTSNFDARNGTNFKSYGMGWFLMDYQGLKVAQHGGGLPGYISKIAIVPDIDLGMIILTNDMSSLPTALMYQIIDEFTDAKEKDWSAEFLEYKKKADEREAARVEEENKSRVMNTKPSHAASAYAGKYIDKMYGEATIEEKDGQLRLIMEPTKELFQGDLSHWHFDTFEFKFNDPFLPRGFVTFEMDVEGKVSGFKIKLHNYDFHFYNLDFKKQK